MLTRREFLQSLAFASLSLALPEPKTVNKPASVPLVGRVLKNNLPIYSEANLKAPSKESFPYDSIVLIRSVLYSRKGIAEWYQISLSQYIPAGWVQLVGNSVNLPQPIPKDGCLGEITTPKAEVYTVLKQRVDRRYFYFENTFWVLALEYDNSGIAWYKLLNEYTRNSFFYVKAFNVRIVSAEELAPLSPNVDPRDKQIEVNLSQQKVRAYESKRPVFEADVSTGLAENFTPVGNYQTNRKRPCRRMPNENNSATSFEFAGVPWVSYISQNGISFHGTYWHANWGYPMSHGCINMKSQDAKWLYRWCNPIVPFDQLYHEEKKGTDVKVVWQWELS